MERTFLIEVNDREASDALAALLHRMEERRGPFPAPAGIKVNSHTLSRLPLTMRQICSGQRKGVPRKISLAGQPFTFCAKLLDQN